MSCFPRFSCFKECINISKQPRFMPHLPLEMLIEVFLRADTQTIGRARSLSREWNLILSSTYFIIKTAAHRDAHNGSLIMQLACTGDSHISDWVRSIETATGVDEPMILPFQPVHEGHFNIIGCDCGNISLRFSYDNVVTHIVVWNPTTHRGRFLPDPAFTNGHNNMARYVFSYVPNSVHYKLAYVYRKNFVAPVFGCQFYSSVQAEWGPESLINEVTIKWLVKKYNVIEGRAYWINRTDDEFQVPVNIISVSMDSEKWAAYKFPTLTNVKRIKLITVQGKLGCMVVKNTEWMFYSEIWKSSEVNNDMEWILIKRVCSMHFYKTPSLMYRDDLCVVEENTADFRLFPTPAWNIKVSTLLINTCDSTKVVLNERVWLGDVVVKDVKLSCKGIFPV